jgi:dTMP kinase
MTDKQPFFIIVDGIDGSGKTTIAKYIEEQTKAVYMRMLGQGPIGKAIREKLLSPKKHCSATMEMLLIFAANLETINDCVAPALQKGQSVILDRYWTSTYAYQINRLNNPVFNTLFKEVATLSYREVTPDLYIWCDVEVRTAIARINQRNEQTNHFDTEDILEKMKVTEGFSKIFQCDILENKNKLNGNADLPTVLQQVDTVLHDFSFI